MSGTWPRRLATWLVCLSAALQLAAIFSPGWLIDVQANIDVQHSVFHQYVCHTLVADTECEVNSFREIYTQARLTKERAGVANVAIAELDYTYHQVVLKQVLVIVSLVATLLLVCIQIWRSCHVDKRAHRLVAWSAVIGTIPTGLMIGVVCQQLVDTSYMSQLRSFDSDRDHTYIGFPYSLAMYIGALTFLFLAVVVIARQAAGPAKQRPPKKKQPVYDEEYGDSKPAVKVEFIAVEETSPVPSPVEKVAKAPVDTKNTVFYSEKL